MIEYSVIIPTLDEEENLRVLLPRLLRPECEVIICDNSSGDGTVSVALSTGAKVSKGAGTVVDAILRGFKLATADRIVVMDADMSHPPTLVPSIVQLLDKHDIVVGSRIKSRDTVKNRLISRLYNLLSWGLAPKVKDRASGFWGIKKILLSTPIRNTKKPLLEFLVRSKHNSVAELPYVFSPRHSGKSKLGRSPFTILSELWSLFLLYMVKYRLLNYAVVGGIGYIINLGVYYPLTLVFEQQVTFLGQVFYLPPYIISASLAGTCNYFFNKWWTFGDRKESQLGFLKYWTILGPTILVDLTIIFLLVQFMHLEPIVAAAIAILSVFLIRYSIANKWIWGKNK